MFFSENILSKKGALARIWLAAHWERKLSKTQFLQTNIEQSVGAIVQNDQPMALRLSGQLLLGVVKIYSRKARYLLEDCNEALLKIKLAFRPGAVDLPDDQATAAYKAITLPDVITEFEILLPEPAFQLHQVQERLSQGTLSQTVSRKEDITISEPTLRSAVLEREIEPDILAMPVADELLAEEFRFDLGLELGTPAKRPRLEAEDSMEIEVGRRAEFDNASFVDNFGFAPDDSFVQDAPKGEDAMGTILTDVVMNEAPLDDFQPFDFNERSRLGEEGTLDLLPHLPELDLQFDVVGPDTNIFPTPAKGTRKVKQAAQPRKRKLHFDSQLEISSRQIQEQMQNPAGTVSIECFLPKYAASVKLRKAEALGMQHMFDASPFDNMVPELQSLWSNHLSVKPHRELPLRLAREAEPAVAMQSDEAGYKRGEPGSPRFEIHEAPLLGDDSFMPADGNFEFAPEDVVPQEHFLECANGVDTPRGNRILQEAGTPFILDAGEMVRSNDRPTESQVDESNPQLTTEAAKVRLQSVFKDQRPGTSVSFIELTGSRKRDEAVRLFFEILLLKTSNVINVEQGEPYGTILVSQRSL